MARRGKLAVLAALGLLLAGGTHAAAQTVNFICDGSVPVTVTFAPSGDMVSLDLAGEGTANLAYMSGSATSADAARYGGNGFILEGSNANWMLTAPGGAPMSCTLTGQSDAGQQAQQMPGLQQPLEQMAGQQQQLEQAPDRQAALEQAPGTLSQLPVPAPQAPPPSQGGFIAQPPAPPMPPEPNLQGPTLAAQPPMPPMPEAPVPSFGAQPPVPPLPDPQAPSFGALQPAPQPPVQAQPQFPRQANPSFRCTGNLNATERTLCVTPDLADLDREMAQTYRRLRASLRSRARSRLRRDQKNWLKRRNRCRANANCLKDVYYYRIADLNAWR